MMTSELKFDDTNIGAAIMEIITAGLYSNNLNCIREYIQNSLDAHPNQINITSGNNGRSVCISDDGDGMDEDELRDALRVGYSDKGPESTGWRGIGIWSGAAVCDKVIIVTKKKNLPRYQVVIECKPLIDPGNRKSKTATEVLSESLKDGLDEDNVEGEEDKSYTHITLSNIHFTLRKTFEPNAISKYVSRTVPLKFKEDFAPGPEILLRLDKSGVPTPRVSIYVNDVEVFKDTSSSDHIFDTPFFKEFREEETGGLLAVGWFISTNRNEKLKDSSITYRKNGFRIGETSLVYSLSAAPFKGWHHGEIHVVDGSITENAARDGFSTAIKETNLLFDQVGNFAVDGLEALAHYTSDSLATGYIEKAKEAKVKNNESDFFKNLESANKKGHSKRKIPEELSAITDVINKKASEEAAEVRRLKNESAEEDDDEDMSMDDLRTRATSRDILKKKSRNFDPAVKEQYDKRTASGRVVPNLLICDPLMKILKEITGETGDTVPKLSKKAFGWDHISHVDANNPGKKKPYAPMLSVSGEIGEDNNNRRNKEFGVFLGFIWDFFNVADKHQILEDLPWYSSMTSAEKAEWTEAGWTMINLAAKMLRHAKRVDQSDTDVGDP